MKCSTPIKHRSRWKQSSRNSYIIYKIKCFSMSKNIFDVFRWATYQSRIKNITICSWVYKKVTQPMRSSAAWFKVIRVRLRVSESRPRYEIVFCLGKNCYFKSLYNQLGMLFINWHAWNCNGRRKTQRPLPLFVWLVSQL